MTDVFTPHSNPSRQATRTKVENTTPPMWRGGALKAFDGRCSPRSAIKAKCHECVGYEDTVERVKTCTVHLCPLWMFRPHQD